MIYTIYLRTNLVNGKQYVGQTCDFKRREMEWNRLNQRYANNYLTEDREKYGLDNWKTEMLAEVDKQEDAWELEQRFINDYNTVFPNGYNMSDGGKTNKGFKVNEETKKEISEKLKKYFNEHPEIKKEKSDDKKGKHISTLTEFEKGHTPWIKGKKHKKESIEKMKESHKGSTPWNKGIKGCISEEQKKKIGEANKKRNSKPIVQIKNGEVFFWASAAECCEQNSFYKMSAVRDAAKGVYSFKKGHNYKDSIWYSLDFYNKMLAEQAN